MVLISGYSHELRLLKNKRFHVFSACSKLTSHCAPFLVINNHMKTRLVLMHGIENDLRTTERASLLFVPPNLPPLLVTILKDGKLYPVAYLLAKMFSSCLSVWVSVESKIHKNITLKCLVHLTDYIKCCVLI